MGQPTLPRPMVRSRESHAYWCLVLWAPACNARLLTIHCPHPGPHAKAGRGSPKDSLSWKLPEFTVHIRMALHQAFQRINTIQFPKLNLRWRIHYPWRWLSFTQVLTLILTNDIMVSKLLNSLGLTFPHLRNGYIIKLSQFQDGTLQHFWNHVASSD